jgi:hypothetical protein
MKLSTVTETKLSENIQTYEAGAYRVTAAIWRTLIDAAGGYVNTYEIGIRNLTTDEFVLLQSEKYTHQSVQEVANAIAHLLSIQTEHYTPEWCQEYMT